MIKEKPSFYLDTYHGDPLRIVWHLSSRGKVHFHREDGPAIIYCTGYHCWYRNGKPHRTNGPAFTGLGKKSDVWYLDGKMLPKQEVEDWIDANNIDIQTEEGEVAFKLTWS